MKTTPEFTDAEIQEMMDFRQVLSLTEAARSRSKKIIRRIVTMALVTGLVGGSLFMYNKFSSSDTSTPPTDNVGTSNVPPATSPPTATVPLDTTRQPATPLRTEVAKKKPAQKPVTADKKKPIAESKEKTSSVRADSAKSVFVPAEPAEGYPALYAYFAKELHYPEQAIKDSIQGVTSVTFVINAEGKPQQVSTDHALPEAFDKEAIRLIANMPAWKPAQLNGSPVKSKLSVPITFTLKTIKTQGQQ